MVISMKFTPDEVLDSAIEIVADEGVSVSTSRIARGAGVSNGTLFNYFPTKQALLDAMYVRIKRGLVFAIGELDDDAELVDRARVIWQRWLRWATIAPTHWRVGRLLTGADLVTPSVVEQSLAGLAGPMAVVEQLESSATAAGLPAGYVGAVIQAQLDVAIELGLNADPAASATAFDVMWQGLTRVLVDRPLQPAGSI